MSETILSIIFSFFAAMVTGLGAWVFYISTLESKRAKEREAEYLKMIKSLENRITAKDIQGFNYLEAAQREDTQEERGQTRSDEDEARIAEMRVG